MVENILDFLADLKLNNKREWFIANKERYEKAKNDFDNIGEELIQKIGEIDSDIKNLNVKDCVFRIYRDVRFSHDKTPYKTHFGIYMASGGGRKSVRGGYYFHLSPEQSFFGAGVWMPPADVLKALRLSIFDNYDEFSEIIHKPEFKKYFPKFYDEEKLKKLPPEFSADFPEPELLKLKNYLVEYNLDDKMIHSSKLIDDLAKLAKTAYPMLQFLNYTVDEVIN